MSKFGDILEEMQWLETEASFEQIMEKFEEIGLSYGEEELLVEEAAELIVAIEHSHRDDREDLRTEFQKDTSPIFEEVVDNIAVCFQWLWAHGYSHDDVRKQMRYKLLRAIQRKIGISPSNISKLV